MSRNVIGLESFESATYIDWEPLRALDESLGVLYFVDLVIM